MSKKMVTYFKKINNLIAKNATILTENLCSGNVVYMPFKTGDKTEVSLTFYLHDKRNGDIKLYTCDITSYFSNERNERTMDYILDVFECLKNGNPIKEFNY